jgi:hypothetical protein
MGADGGLYFLRVKNVKHRARLMELLRPLDCLEHKVSDNAEIANDVYLKNNPEYQSNEYIVGNYGTDISDDSLTLWDIRILCEIIKKIIDNDQKNKKYFSYLKNVFGIDIYNHTFYDLKLEIETAPDLKLEIETAPDYKFPNFFVTRKIGKSIIHYMKYNEIIECETYKMTLIDFYNEINQKTHWQSLIVAETWT